MEYIIIDGGSSDGSLEIIKKYEQHLHYWTSEKDNGQYHAVQKGFEQSSGEIMTYINSDDTFSEKSLFSIAQLFTDYPQVQWAGGISNHIDESDRRVWVGNHQRWNKYRYLNLDFEYIQQEGVFWTRPLWQKAGSYISTEYKLASDLDLWSRFFEHETYYSIPGIMGSFRIRSINQRSLEGLDAYTAEAKTILARMPRTNEETNNLQLAGSFLFKLFRRKRFRQLFHLLGWHKVEQQVYRFAPLIDFDRKGQKFYLKHGTEIMTA